MTISVFIDINTGSVRPFWTDMQASGMLPGFLDANDKTPAKDQMEVAYGYGWYSAMDNKPKITNMSENAVLKFGAFPTDPDRSEVSRCVLPSTMETIILFQSDWVAVLDSKFKLTDIARLD